MINKYEISNNFSYDSKSTTPDTDYFNNETYEKFGYYWESQRYNKAYFSREINKKFKYYDQTNFVKFLFFNWVTNWAYSLSKSYIEPYKLHPLPINDQILYWQPIFSKHVSDGIVRLESNGYFDPDGRKYVKVRKSVLLRALFLTFWKRTLIVLLSVITTNVFSMNIAILVKYLLKIMKSRLVHIIQYCVSITVFQHGLCYRRRFFNHVNGANTLNVCNCVLHTCSPESVCSDNPFFCSASRFQNKEITPRMFAFEFIDSYYISLFCESIVYTFNFLSNSIYGVILISFQMRVNMWVLSVVGVLFIFLMVVVELLNTLVLNAIYKIKDYRIAKSIEIISALPIINKILYDDIAINVITECRNRELTIIITRVFLTFLNKSLYVICNSLSFYILIRYFVKTINDVELVTEIDTEGFLSTFYIFFKIIDSLNIIPHTIKRFVTAYTSYYRVSKFINNCSPNFYIIDNKFTGSIDTSDDLVLSTDELDKDVVVLYKDASFTWVNNRKDLDSLKYQPYLEKINFQLKRGEIAIISGNQGCGKSNFIKSVLGEMTLIEGSMAVVPLHTSMPIFYASQEIWLQQGTIRSNIIFGHKFDEVLYNTVLKAVELESDISSWEKGDLRVVSNYAYCLSGGQRVRMEMARAIYAYLVFSKVNREYNRNQCTFLMCLDAPFHGLDPFVSRSVFHNLFNLKTGLLIKDDLSIIMSSSLLVLDKCIRTSELNMFPKIPIYDVNKNSFSFNCYLSDVYSKKLPAEKFKYFSSINNTNHMNFLTKDMFGFCYSGSTTRIGRPAVTKLLYEHSFNAIVKNDYAGDKFNPYALYFKAAGVTFGFFIILTLVSSVMDNVKFILATNLSDYIAKCTKEYQEGNSPNLMEIKSKSNSLLQFFLFFICSIIILSLTSSVFLSLSCIYSSRKIHEYCIRSIFKNSSTVIKIKKFTSQVVTYLSSDIFQIDEGLGYVISSTFISLIELFIHLVTLFYLVPISTPIITIALFLIYKLFINQYVKSSKYLQMGSLESMGHINTVCENAISGSPIFRSFKREWEFMHNLIEHTDYYMRCRFLNKSLISWTSILSNWSFSVTTFVTLFIPIMVDNFSKYKVKIGYFGLALSLSMNVIKTFNTFATGMARLEIYMCSVRRFQLFIPPGTKCVFEKKINIHEEDLVVNSACTDVLAEKKRVLKRRVNEFKSTNKNVLLKLGFRPKINIIDIVKYLPPEHSGVVLKDVCVYTTPQMNIEGRILNIADASAKPGDIIGLIGRTGAGKTTLLSVLQNTVRNRTGQVLMDGRDMRDIPRSALRQIVGVLPQLPFVFKGWTIRRFLDPRKLFSDDEINEALENCGLLEFVNNLQGGKSLDSVIIMEDITIESKEEEPSARKTNTSLSFKSETRLTMDSLKYYYDESDMLLSSSQLRTLAFANLVLYRAFYRMILVDEPPSDNCALQDSFNHDLGLPIYELIKKYFNHCCTFIAAHEATVLRMCTSVWVIHSGSIIRTVKVEEISANESISNIIEQSVNNKLM
ncbi:ABC transporter family protein [Theileria parva strain Muguga]|uniref:ABC transporter, putative n=1 Tax=Theileria parva TaxID=5875 RepID=Q4N5A2_THEPA|nr:ABC transporter family protein [Theileria parva strain Muguga]EAN32671.1 ABC transporter family protein [Theileria parva strain Muguga]|eukprot:XP_764954.1 ABC transporter [Theileria parva strain Muguga]